MRQWLLSLGGCLFFAGLTQALTDNTGATAGGSRAAVLSGDDSSANQLADQPRLRGSAETADVPFRPERAARVDNPVEPGGRVHRSTRETRWAPGLPVPAGDAPTARLQSGRRFNTAPNVATGRRFESQDTDNQPSSGPSRAVGRGPVNGR